MTKVIIRETIISLLVCLAILLILSVALYNYIPSNKVIPQAVQYSPSSEIQTQLNAEVEDNSEQILMTYEVTASDLEHYEKTDEYNPGKVNPFAPVSDKPTDTGDGNTTSDGNNNTGSNNSGTNNSNGDSTNNNSGGSLFEGGSSK